MSFARRSSNALDEFGVRYVLVGALAAAAPMACRSSPEASRRVAVDEHGRPLEGIEVGAGVLT